MRKKKIQTLAASALGWVMSTALREQEKGADGSGQRLDVRPLLSLLEQGDVAAFAASAVLTRLALERPPSVIPEVRRDHYMNSGFWFYFFRAPKFSAACFFGGLSDSVYCRCCTLRPFVFNSGVGAVDCVETSELTA